MSSRLQQNVSHSGFIQRCKKAFSPIVNKIVGSIQSFNPMPGHGIVIQSNNWYIDSMQYCLKY